VSSLDYGCCVSVHFWLDLWDGARQGEIVGLYPVSNRIGVLFNGVVYSFYVRGSSYGQSISCYQLSMV